MDTITMQLDPNTGKYIFAQLGKAYLPEMVFAPKATGPWESDFKYYEHPSEVNPDVMIDKHVYLKLRNQGTEEWSTPARFIGEDGVGIELSIFEKVLYSKKDGEEKAFLFDLNTLKGENGEPGVAGKGCTIDRAMFYDEMMALNASGLPTTACKTCATPNQTTTTGLYTVLVMGDNRTHTIIAADWVGTQYHKVDDTSEWVKTTGADIGRKVMYYGYDLSDPTTIKVAYLENEVSAEFPVGKRNTVWVSVEGLWVNIPSITQPSYAVSRNLANAEAGIAGYLEDFNGSTVALDAVTGVFEVKVNTLAGRHFHADAFNFGFKKLTPESPIDVDVTQFSGYGTTSYVETSSGDTKQQIDLTDVAGDGTEVIVEEILDGATHYKIQAKPEDLVATNAFPDVSLDADGNGGAIGWYISTVDGFKNFFVKTGKGIRRILDNLEAFVDERTLSFGDGAIDDENAIVIKPTDDGDVLNDADGVQFKHVHKNVFDRLKGLWKEAGASARILLDLKSLEFDTTTEPTEGRITIAENGVKLGHLDTANGNTAKGIEVSEDGAIEAKVDDTYTEFDKDGNITIKDIPENLVVDSLNGKTGTVTLDPKVNTYITTAIAPNVDISIKSIIVSAVLNFEALKVALKTYFDGIYLTTVGTIAWGGLFKTTSGTGDTLSVTIANLEAELALRVPYNTWIGDSAIAKNGTGDFAGLEGWVVREAGSTGAAKTVHLDSNGSLTAS